MGAGTTSRDTSRWRVAAALLALVLVTGACSGGGFPGDDPEPIALTNVDADGDPSTPDGDASPDEPGATNGPNGSGGGGNGGGGGGGNGSGGGGSSGSGGGGGGGGGGGSGPPAANLFTAEEDRIGITDTTISLCAHAALILGPAFDVYAEDLNVYWDMVNEKGIHGRRVSMAYYDDRYDPTAAQEAAERCREERNPFILLSGIGFDQIPAVRSYAEEQHMLYLHHVARQDLSMRYSFSPLPTVEQMGKLAGQWIATRHRSKKAGAMYRDSENWDPGYTAFAAEYKRLTGRTVDGIPVRNGQGTYQTQINTLRDAGVSVVFLWENALNATEIILQAKQQDWHPKWVVFPFNLETDTLRDDALEPPIEGIAAWTAYTPGDYSGPFAEYADEIRRFEAAYRKYRPSTELNDFHWQTWLAWKSIHQILVACGRDCTRNKVVGYLLSRKFPYAETHPNCPVDFTRNGHVGGFAATFYEAYRGPNGAAWRHVPGYHCRESLV